MLRSRDHRHLTVIFAGLIAVVLIGIGLVVSALPASAAGGTIAGPEEYDLLAMTNQARAQYGLGPLSDDVAARNVARSWSLTMAATHIFDHNPYLASQVSQQVTNDWTALGENVGTGASVSQVQAAFMASTPHRMNILGDYNRVGVGVARDSGGQLWMTLVFIKGPAIPYVPPSTWSPYPSPYYLANGQFQDFLGYDGSPDNVDVWATLLREGAVTEPGVTEGFLRSPESQATVAPVTRLCFAYFLRVPDYPGIDYWITQVRAGASLKWASDLFAQSNEFKARYGTLTNGAYVDLVYSNVLHRPPDQSGRQYWLDALNQGTKSRGDVMLGFSESIEYKSTEASEVDVTMTYVAMLRRAPDSAGYSYWRGQLDAGVSVQALMGSIDATSEYRNRVT